MAGKIIADQIQSTTAGTVDTKYLYHGTKKAWTTDGTLAAPSGFTNTDSFLISSVTDSALGTAIVNLTNAFADDSYPVLVDSVGAYVALSANGKFSGSTTSSDKVLLYRSGPNVYLDSAFCWTAMGDLA